MHAPRPPRLRPRTADRLFACATAAACASLAGCVESTAASLPVAEPPAASRPEQPVDATVLVQDARGDARAGRAAFRGETFGNEGFWTDALRLPQGMRAQRWTPIDALDAGLSIDVDALDADLLARLASELATDRTPAEAPLLNDPSTTDALLRADAFVGLVASGEKVGVSCALCHSTTDGSLAATPGAGSVGRRVDGRAAHGLALGRILAVAENSRALYPLLQLELAGATRGRAQVGLTPESSEAEVDAYLRDESLYPRGAYDHTPDGVGNPVVVPPAFRQDLAGPYGANGLHVRLETACNTATTVALDPTTLATEEGRVSLDAALPGGVGDELHDGYARVLAATGVERFPSVRAEPARDALGWNTPASRRADAAAMLDVAAYLIALPAPAGIPGDDAAIARGRELFRASCERCHEADPRRPVGDELIALAALWPEAEGADDDGAVRDLPGTYDDALLVWNARPRGEKLGLALPLLLDLAGERPLLHDASVVGLERLLDPRRGPRAPHPFYRKHASERADLVAFLESLDLGTDTGRGQMASAR